MKNIYQYKGFFSFSGFFWRSFISFAVYFTSNSLTKDRVSTFYSVRHICDNTHKKKSFERRRVVGREVIDFFEAIYVGICRRKCKEKSDFWCVCAWWYIFTFVYLGHVCLEECDEIRDLWKMSSLFPTFSFQFSSFFVFPLYIFFSASVYTLGNVDTYSR